jgi:hypothetical protein
MHASIGLNNATLVIYLKQAGGHLKHGMATRNYIKGGSKENKERWTLEIEQRTRVGTNDDITTSALFFLSYSRNLFLIFVYPGGVRI